MLNTAPNLTWVGIWSQVLILCGRSFTHCSFPTDPCSAFYLGPEDHTHVFCLSSKYFNKWFGIFDLSPWLTVKCCSATNNCFSSFFFFFKTEWIFYLSLRYILICVLYSSDETHQHRVLKFSVTVSSVVLIHTCAHSGCSIPSSYHPCWEKSKKMQLLDSVSFFYI